MQTTESLHALLLRLRSPGHARSVLGLVRSLLCSNIATEPNVVVTNCGYELI